jgi:hypothetical protein
MTILIRRCPEGHERPLSELVCEGLLHDGNVCRFPLPDIFPVPATPDEPKGMGERDQDPYETTTTKGGSPPPEAPARMCPNGHAVSEDDAICLTCGETVAAQPAEPDSPIRTIGEWQILAALPGPADEAELFLARSEDAPETVLLKYHQPGIEPDSKIYPALARLEAGAAATLIAHGRLCSRAFEVWEHIDSPTLGDLRSEFRSNPALLHEVAANLIRTLANFESFGLRHGGLKPSVVRVLSPEPVRLVVTDFATANLAEFDVEIARLRQASRYMAPEAVAEASTSASDWWSLGIILLELATDGTCFAGVHDRTFLLHLS